MIYPDSFENKIGFAAVRATVRGLCMSQTAGALCDEMSFDTDYASVNESLGKVGEMVSLIESGDDVPLHNMCDIDRLLASLAVEGTFLTADELSTDRKSVV